MTIVEWATAGLKLAKQLAADSGRSSKWNLDGSCPVCGKFSLSTYGNFCCYCGADMRDDEVPESDTPLNNVGLKREAE